jgi:hypothetical protein
MGDTWSNHVAIVVSGVLKQPNDNAVIIPGFLLYKSLVKDHRVSLIFDAPKNSKVQYWLLTNSLTDHVNEIYWDVADPEDTPSRRLAQIGRLRKNGPLTLVFESDTEVAAALLKAGIPSFLFIHPQYMHPEHRPGFSSEPTPWSELLTEKVRQQEARATDTRLKEIF